MTAKFNHVFLTFNLDQFFIYKSTEIQLTTFYQPTMNTRKRETNDNCTYWDKMSSTS